MTKKKKKKKKKKKTTTKKQKTKQKQKKKEKNIVRGSQVQQHTRQQITNVAEIVPWRGSNPNHLDKEGEPPLSIISIQVFSETVFTWSVRKARLEQKNVDSDQKPHSALFVTHPAVFRQYSCKELLKYLEKSKYSKEFRRLNI